ncbi:putative disease resistance protein RGA3 [Papaver somniferum]|uniref:putative disease resistance protein RGA3 n=1 Tax=Papaver somniferum TaxID=3469 RepID=UPI000E704C88|nr:putative disease resistance protein RGA3 [Papaver somniferum]
MTSPNVLLNAMKLRTIIALNPEIFSPVNSFFRHKRLRILCPLGGWREYPLSRGFEFRHMKHLRYLDLSYIDLSREVSLSHSYNLQTLILRWCKNVPSWFLSKIGSLKSLRHLDISSSDIRFIPENIGSLEHLSCLDLSCTPISKLPDSITRISSLKILKFDRCYNLDALPRKLGALTRLTCIDLRGTSIKVLPESCITNLCNLEIVRLGRKCELPKEIKNWTKLRIFTYDGWNDVMPRGMENLTSLEELDYVASRSGIEELGGLNSLKVLGITNLENVKGGKEGAETAKLKDKQHLRELNLYWGINDDDDDDEVRNSRSVNVVFEGLQPHSNLKKLRLDGFSGFNFPKWMMGCSLNLVELILRNCDQLPALGMLPFLRVLLIWGMKSIKCLGEEIYYQQENQDEEEESISSTKISSSLFPSLIKLEIELENLEEWVAPPLSSTTSCFPSLESLEISGCKRLRTAPITCFSSIKKLELWGTNDNAVNSFFNRGGGGLTSLTEIIIKDSPDVIYLPPLGVLLQHNTPNLQCIDIAKCSSFQGFRDEDLRNNSNNINSLRSLFLSDCPVLTSLPDLRLFTCIQSLYLQDCPGLTSLPDLRLCTSLRRLTIHKCDKLNKKSIPYDLKKSLTFLVELKVDFIQRDEGGPDVYYGYELMNLMEKKK